MMALKIFWVIPTWFSVCASKTSSNSSACRNFRGQHP